MRNGMDDVGGASVVGKGRRGVFGGGGRQGDGEVVGSIASEPPAAAKKKVGMGMGIGMAEAHPGVAVDTGGGGGGIGGSRSGSGGEVGMF